MLLCRRSHSRVAQTFHANSPIDLLQAQLPGLSVISFVVSLAYSGIGLHFPPHGLSACSASHLTILNKSSAVGLSIAAFPVNRRLRRICMARRDELYLTVPCWFSISLIEKIRTFVFGKFYVPPPLPSVPRVRTDPDRVIHIENGLDSFPPFGRIKTFLLLPMTGHEGNVTSYEEPARSSYHNGDVLRGLGWQHANLVNAS